MWKSIEERVLENEALINATPAAHRRPFMARLQAEGVDPRYHTKKMVAFSLSSGATMLWELSGAAHNFFVDCRHTSVLKTAGFEVEPRLFDRTSPPDGGRHSALSRDWAFGDKDCLCVKVDNVSDVGRLVRLLS